MRVADIMSRDVITITVDTTVQTASEIMREYDVHFLPVILEDVCAGVLTDRDIRTKVLDAGRDPATTAAAEAMSRGLGRASAQDLGANEAIAAVPEDATLDEALALMNRFGVRRLAVHNSDYAIIGIVSRSDIPVAEAAHQA